MLNLYPHHIFFEKVINQITHRKNKLWRFLPANRISFFGIGEEPGKIELKTRLIDVLGDVDIAVKKITEKERLQIISCADQTIAHQFEYLGSGKVEMPSIKWHEDFKSGNKWKKGVFYLQQRKSTAKGADIKVPWELSRGHHLLWLGEAYLLTKEEKYAKEMVDEIEDWWKENPFMYSVNWTCTMDVAIRSVNWMYAVAMVLDSSLLSEPFIKKLYRSLYQHGWYIYNNLERTIPYSNNHLFSDLAGLLYLSLLFIDTNNGKRWLKYAESALYDEIRCQVLPSGVHFERSVSYHRLMTEMVIASLYALKRNSFTIPSDIEYQAGNMLSYISSYTKPNHLSPLIEDNDDGRFLPFVFRDFRQHDYLLNPYSAENLLLSNGVEPISYETRASSTFYKDAGHAVLRNDQAYLFITNGEQSGYEINKPAIGTHTHNDKLSFEFAIGDEDIIIDPGAYIYTPDPKRSNEFRSTLKHNTVIVDKEEQNGLSLENVFLARKNSHAILFRKVSDSCFEGAYKTFKEGLAHHRTFNLSDDSLLVTDILSKEGTAHSAVVSFHFDENLHPKNENGGVSISTNDFSVNMEFEANGIDYLVDIFDDTVSPSYGVLRNAKTVRVSFTFDERAIFKTTIKWLRRR